VANRSAKSWVFKFFDFLGDALESVRQLSFQFFAFARGHVGAPTDCDRKPIVITIAKLR
jgi:hypothetical protein